ncbi:MAG: outer membrane lipoprotein carrier protein LolA [Rhodobacterales bacterium]|nr:outer membrane lipoprotein carrier protein LolA [Rhodobacterales bacterium]
MEKLRYLLAPVIAVALAMPASAEKLALSEISAFLNAMKTAKSPFTQINDDGTISTGTLFIKRPGRVRFEYNPPDDTLVLASGGAVAIFDSKSNAGPQTYPLNKTPLSIILGKNVNLGQARMVTGHGYDGTATTITAQDPDHPEYGNIQLVFTPNPVQLRQWVINDDTGSQTTVILGDLQAGGILRDSIFNIQLQADKDAER